MTLKYGDSKSRRRKTVPDTKLQKLAQKENFAIWLLKGRTTHFLKGVVPSSIIAEIEYWQKIALLEIKKNQQDRNPKRKIKP